LGKEASDRENRATRLRVALGAVTLGAAVIAASPARADVVYDLFPTVTVGATDNVTLATTTPTGGVGQLREGDGFTSLTVSAGLRYQAARSSHQITYRLTLTRFLEHPDADVFTNDVIATSSFDLTAKVNLRLSASGALSRTSSVDFGNAATATPTGTAQGANTYLATTFRQDLSYQPNPRRSYAESLSLAQIHYLDAVTPLPEATTVAATLRARRLFNRETIFVETQLSDSIATNAMPGAFNDGQVFVAQVMGGWRHELGPSWSTEVAAGPILMFKAGGPAVLAPGGSASLNYVNQYWFAGVAAAQVAAPNLYLGSATINDQIIARLALPLGRSERYYAVGYGGYAYARIATEQGSLTRYYDQLMAGASLAARLPKVPFNASLSYTLLDQRGSSSPINGNIPDIARQTVMLNVTGMFTFGPGTPPILGVN
jgi:hypothetical protein